MREAAPRSFKVETSEGVFRRNQSDLVTMATGKQETPLSIESETTKTGQDTPPVVPGTNEQPSQLELHRLRKGDVE